MYQPVTKKDVVAVLEALRQIQRPDGDNEGDPINAPTLYDELSKEDQERVDRALDVTNEYLRKTGDFGDEPNTRSITELNKAGFPTTLNQDQYQPDRLVGRVRIGDVTLDVSDEVRADDDY